jgi:hypothetical protein
MQNIADPYIVRLEQAHLFRDQIGEIYSDYYKEKIQLDDSRRNRIAYLLFLGFYPNIKIKRVFLPDKTLMTYSQAREILDQKLVLEDKQQYYALCTLELLEKKLV